MIFETSVQMVNKIKELTGRSSFCKLNFLKKLHGYENRALVFRGFSVTFYPFFFLIYSPEILRMRF